MNAFKQSWLLATSMILMLSFITIDVYAFTSCTINPAFKTITPIQNNNCDDNELANKCRELALKIDWLSRYQDRPACTQNLDGVPLYFAAYHLDKKNKSKAEELLEEAMVKLNFAFAIGCYGQNDMKQLISDIKVLIKAINA